MNGIDGSYASPAVRDGFLSAIDRHDGVTLTRLARDMTSCGNPLPSATCTQLGIPIGSTYGFAARRLGVHGTEGWLTPRPAVSRPAAWQAADDAIAAGVAPSDAKVADPAA
jgi:hypothetical protein